MIILRTMSSLQLRIYGFQKVYKKDLILNVTILCRLDCTIGMLKHFDIFDRSALCNFVG